MRKYFNYNLETRKYVISDHPLNDNPSWISKKLDYCEDFHHCFLMAIADMEIYEFDLPDSDVVKAIVVFQIGLEKYFSMYGRRCCSSKEDIHDIIDFLTYYSGKTDYECVYQIRNQGDLYGGEDFHEYDKFVVFDRSWEKRNVRLFGRIEMIPEPDYGVDRRYYDLVISENDETPNGYKLLGDFTVCGDRFNVSSWVSEKNEILSTAIAVPDIFNGLDATPEEHSEMGVSSYYWGCLYSNGKWLIADQNEVPW